MHSKLQYEANKMGSKEAPEYLSSNMVQRFLIVVSAFNTRAGNKQMLECPVYGVVDFRHGAVSRSTGLLPLV
jgi:hypothetical protein